MQNQKLTFLFLLMLVSSFCTIRANENPNVTSDTEQITVERNQQNDWIYLGKVTACNDVSVQPGHLYVYSNPVGGYLYYKFVVKDNSYSVVKAGKQINGVIANGMIMMNKQPFYLVVPSDVAGFQIKN